MAYGELNGHMTDEVMWPWNVKLVIPICLGPNISKTAGDSILQQLLIYYNLLWGSTVGYPSDSLSSCYICNIEVNICNEL